MLREGACLYASKGQKTDARQKERGGEQWLDTSIGFHQHLNLSSASAEYKDAICTRNVNKGTDGEQARLRTVW